ncbi:MAG: hypothetical protein H7Y38_08785, partial [Armatimonadetes bacterium]|nr:hypothetical protein [Armatimonadota bacterium]
MKLFPQHLRDRQHAEIVRRRTYGLRGKGDLTAATGATSGALSAKPLPEPQTGMLGRFWAKGSGLTEKQAATGLPAAASSTLGTVWAIPGIMASFSFLIGVISLGKHGNPDPLIISSAATAVLGVLSALPFARSAFRACYKHALNEGEIEHLIETTASTATPTETAYLRLVRDAVRQNSPVSAETQAEIQSAIVSLGEAIDRLPVLNIAPVDTDALRREAELLQADADTNLDRVIGESLERRADALLRRADAAER